MRELTGRQEAILGFIERYRMEHSISPSFREIQEHFGFRSPHAVTKHLEALERKGVVGVREGMARSILSLRPNEREVPLVGKIVAGVPVEAMENVEGRLDLAFMDIDNTRRDFFALTVRGESMIQAHIMDGDMVVIRKQGEVGEHEIAAVLWNGEATLKYLRRRGKEIWLVPANAAMKPIHVRLGEGDTFQILGKVVTVIRKYI